jgi:hypothetical protein
MYGVMYGEYNSCNVQLPEGGPVYGEWTMVRLYIQLPEGGPVYGEWTMVRLYIQLPESGPAHSAEGTR